MSNTAFRGSHDYPNFEKATPAPNANRPVVASQIRAIHQPSLTLDERVAAHSQQQDDRKQPPPSTAEIPPDGGEGGGSNDSNDDAPDYMEDCDFGGGGDHFDNVNDDDTFDNDTFVGRKIQRNCDGAPIMEGLGNPKDIQEYLASGASKLMDISGHYVQRFKDEEQWMDSLPQEEDDDDDILNQPYTPRETFNEESWKKYQNACPKTKDWGAECKLSQPLPPYYIALMDLLKILEGHQVDLKVFDSVVEWVLHHSRHDKNSVWTKEEGVTQYRTRAAFIRFMSRTFHTEHLLPTMKKVEFEDGSESVVPCYDFKDMLTDLLTDEDVNREENFIRSGIDKKTWAPTNPRSDWTDDDIIDDVNTGTVYHEGYELHNMKKKLDPKVADEVRVVGLQFFIDKSHSDLFGSLATTPVSFTLMPYNNETRRKNAAWRTIAYIPNLDVGKGRSKGYDPKRDADKKAGKKVPPKGKYSLKKLDKQHRMYRVAFESMVKAYKEGGVVINIKGVRVLVRFFVGSVICDTVGANEFCCHYNSTGNAKVSALCKNCKCGFEDLIAVPPRCQPITKEDVIKSLTDDEHAKKVSQHPVKSAFNELPLANLEQPINDFCPFENLHVNANGLFQDVVNIIQDMIGKKTKNAAKKDELDYIFRLVAVELTRNANRDLPRITTRYGCLDATRITGSEMVGTIFILIVVFHTDWGQQLMSPYIKKAPKGVTMSGLIRTMTLLLSYDRWTQDRNIRRWELNWAKSALCSLMEDMQRHLPNPRIEKQKPDKKKRTRGRRFKKRAFKKRAKKGEKGSNGWYKIKYHALWGLLKSMHQYGSATNFHGGPGEEHHKDNVKKRGHNTQKRSRSYTCQVSQRSAEAQIILYCHRFVRGDCVPQKLRTSSVAHDYSLKRQPRVFSSASFRDCEDYAYGLFSMHWFPAGRSYGRSGGVKPTTFLTGVINGRIAWISNRTQCSSTVFLDMHKAVIKRKKTLPPNMISTAIPR